MRLEQAILSRRSLRRFALRPVPAEVIRELVALACAAPAPHHSHPWRFVDITSAEARNRLAEAMADAWRRALKGDGQPPTDIERLIARSRPHLIDAPALLLACLTMDAARPWPDQRRRLAERDMFVQSLGASLQNLLLAAHSRGLAGYLKGAPLFCPDAVRQALDLPAGWQPAFLVLLGYSAEDVAPAARPPIDPDEFLVQR